MSPVVLSDTESVDRFYRFIFADAVARAPYIYGLNLFCAGSGSEKYDSRLEVIHDRLVALLEVATHLECLHTTAAMDGPILIAVAKLTTLRELSVPSESGPHPEISHKFLTALRSPLRSLHVLTYPSADRDISASFLHDQLAHFAPTLEVLDVGDFTLDISPPSVTTPFTAMRTLKTGAICGFYQQDVLLCLFPNLHDIFIPHDLVTTDPYPVIRQRNKDAQKTCTWWRLDRVVCTALSAYLVAIQCPIRRMDINREVSFKTRCLAETLRHNSPRQLSFHIVLWDGLRMLDGLFPSEGAGRLSHLVMLVGLEVHREQTTMVHNNDVFWDPLMDRLIDSMKHLRLMHYYNVYQASSRKTRPNTVFDGEFVNIAREADLHPAATRFFDAMPTLQYVFLTTCGHTYLLAGGSWNARNKWSSSKAWQVDDVNEKLRWSNGKRGSCVEMSDEAAKVVMDREELQLLPAKEGFYYVKVAPLHTDL
ncbi:hypothetical protein LXA43DRAFT_1182178 [Ganoderma leucocontextum]|nr:hypothetical protein LXA43DRAFT_1182178 [Ganoderma leucocontextum]